MRVNTKKLQRAIDRVPGKVTKNIRKAFLQHGEVFRSAMVRKRFTGGRNRLKTRTGKLQRSVRSNVRGRKLDDLRLLVSVGGGVASKYAGIQEFGGTVHGNPWLTIPLSDNLTAAGVPRFKSAAALRGSGKTFLAKMPSGKLLIGQRFGRGGKSVRWLWVLKRFVVLKPRLGFFKMWSSRAMRADRNARINKAVRKALVDSVSKKS